MCIFATNIDCFDLDNQVASDEEGVAGERLPPYTDGDNEEAVSLLNTEVPATRRMKRKRSKACCMCCGLK